MRITATVALQLALLPGAAFATIMQNPLYSDNMMLESGSSYDVRPFISGFGTVPGEAVNVTFMGRSYATTVGAVRNDPATTVDCPACMYNWEVQMNSCYATRGMDTPSSYGPLNETLVVKGESNTLAYTHVACGQVYVCSERPGCPHTAKPSSEQAIRKGTNIRVSLFGDSVWVRFVN